MALRILCFHGFGGNAEFLRYQLRNANWDTELRELATFHSLNGRLQNSGDEAVKKYSAGPYYAWWDATQRDQGTRTYDGWRETMTYVSEYLTENGPFDGVLGFSQGACLASLMISLQQQNLEFTDFPLFKFAILISGFASRDRDHLGLYQAPIHCRSLHVIGINDEIKRWSERLVQRFDDPVVIEHSGGHVIPQLDETQMNTIKRFLTSHNKQSKL